MALAIAPAEVSDLAALARSFRRSLRARNRSPRTIDQRMERVARAAKITKADMQGLQLSREQLRKPIKEWYLLQPLSGTFHDPSTS